MAGTTTDDTSEIGFVNEPLEPDKSIEEIRKEPLRLLDGFAWDTLDINNSSVVGISFNFFSPSE